MRIKQLSNTVPLIALVLRIIYLGEIWGTPEFSHPGLDGAYHLYWAQGLAEGDWTDFAGREDPQLYRFPYYRPPGYAYFLALVFKVCGSDLLWTRLFQFALGVGSAWLLLRFTRRYFDEFTAFLAGSGAAIYWIFIYYEGEVVGVAWSVFLLILFADRLAAAGEKFRGHLAAGVVLGVLALFRPNALLLLPAGALWAAWPLGRRPGRVRLAAVTAGLTLGVCLAILPATVRNYLVAQELVPIATNAGISLGVANNEFSDGASHSIPGIGNIGSPFDWPRIVRKLELTLGRPLSHGEASNYLSRQAIQFAFQSPRDFLLLQFRKALLFWGPQEVRNLREVHYARIQSPLLRRLPGNFSLVLAAAVLGGILLGAFPDPRSSSGGGGERRGGFLIGAVILVYFLSLLPFAAAARYRVPVIPFLLILAAFATRRIFGLAVAGQWPRALAAGVGGAGLYLILAINYAGFEPSREKWHYDRGLARLAAGEYAAAVAEFDRAILVQPGSATAYANRGIALQKGGRGEAAAESYLRAIQLDPGSLAAVKNLADLRLAGGDGESAFALYRRALEIGPEYTGVAIDLARGLAGEGRKEEAAEVYREILRLRPETPAARLGLGNLLQEAGDPGAAGAQYRAALKINPHSVLARYNLANVLIEEGRLEEGIAGYREVLRRHPGHRDTRNNLGIALAARGDYAPALGHFAAAIQSDPADPAGYYNRGIALLQLGRISEAIGDLEKTLELRPDYEPARRALAMARGAK